MSQTSYDLNMAAGMAGMKYDLRPDRVESFAAEGSIDFGKFCSPGTNASKQVKQATTGITSVKGISLFSHGQEQDIRLSANNGELTAGAEYRDTDAVNVMRQGATYMDNKLLACVDGDTAWCDLFSSTDKGSVTPVPNVNVLVFSADFVASNTINLKLNTGAIAQVTYGTSHAATFAALVTAIETKIAASISTRYSVTGDATTRTITIISNVDITVTDVVVAAGASQATCTVTETNNVNSGGVIRSAAAVGAVAAVEINLP